ncbi:MAG: hypothetical protein P8126_04830 [Gammaproteobacteria bacterium]|jgi:hypothetical protein
MTTENEISQTEALEKVNKFIFQQVKDGADKDTIIARLEETGLAGNQASELVNVIYPEIMRAAKEQAFTTDILPLAVIGGVLAAVIGGAVWGEIVIYTGYEVGFVAWAIGLLSGAAIVFFARGRKGTPLQALAVVSSIAGIVIGKYVAFYHFLGIAIAKKYGEMAAAKLSILSGDVVNYFVHHVSSMLGGYDLIWVALAVITAWRIPEGMGIKPRAYVRT